MSKITEYIRSIGLRSGDEEDVSLQKQFLVYQGLLMGIGGIIWGIGACLLDKVWQSSIPFGYMAITVINMMYFKVSKNFSVTKTIQTAISLLLPFLFQWSLGGFVSSGAVMLWALLALVVSVTYQSTRTMGFWLALFVVLTVFSALYDEEFGQMVYHADLLPYSLFFFALNITVISAIFVWLFNFMVRGKSEALRRLKEAQEGLIHSEKMASLGEMTAGIAHEIQNPLNFVNNFSEVNQELLVEMLDSLDRNDFDEAKAIAKDVSGNAEKITFHGRRADTIVKSMLQHSRTGSGKKEITDINTLVDEYLRLAYHGFRAKDKSFNVEFHAALDPVLPKVEMVEQDIGRVLLNLMNNAFYSCTEKARNHQTDEYKPSVTVSTRNLGSKIEICVRDNGMGIPKLVREKIFQPFFTTKPTGQGTGLGLSISYDIIKAHNGEMNVESTEGEGSAFIIQLPKQVA